jgi:hypothetical protein
LQKQVEDLRLQVIRKEEDGAADYHDLSLAVEIHQERDRKMQEELKNANNLLQELAKVQGQLAASEATRDEAGTTMAGMVALLQAAEHRAETRVQEAEQQGQDIENELQRALQRLQETEQKLQEAEQQQQEAEQQQLKDAEQMLEQAQQQQKELQEAEQKLQEAEEQQLKDAEQHQKELREAEQKLQEAEEQHRKELQEAEQKLQEAEDNFSELEQELDEAVEERDDFRGLLNREEFLCSEVRSELDLVTGDNERISEELADVEAERLMLQMQLDESQQQLQEANGLNVANEAKLASQEIQISNQIREMLLCMNQRLAAEDALQGANANHGHELDQANAKLVQLQEESSQMTIMAMKEGDALQTECERILAVSMDMDPTERARRLAVAKQTLTPATCSLIFPR